SELDLPDPAATISLPGVNRGLRGEPLLRARAGGGTVTLAARRDDGSIELAFDPDDTVARLLARRALTERPPLSARLPFPYPRLPSPVRRIARDLLVRRRASVVADYPSWPVEASVETVRAVYLAVRLLLDPKNAPTPFWPDGKRFAL